MENKKLTPHFFFTTLGMVITLLVSSVALINLVFQTLNQAFPDVLTAVYQYGYQSYNFDGVRAALATLIIAFPVYLFLAKLWKKYISKGLSTYDDVLKKWVLYIIIFLISLTALIDLIVLVRFFVSGEITLRFILKVIAVISVCSLVGAYYINMLKKGCWNVEKIVPLVSAFFVIISIVYSFSIIGSPASQRQLRLDQRRLEDLQNIQYQIINFWQQKEKLPEQLNELIDPLQSWQSIPKDPEFEKGRLYEYRKIEAQKFEVCATFSKPIPKGWQEEGRGGVYPMYKGGVGMDIAVSSIAPYGFSNETWDHGEGRTCFERTIDKERYPPFPKQ